MNNISNSNTQDSAEPRLPKNFQEFLEHFQVEQHNQIKRDGIKKSTKILNSPFFGAIKNHLKRKISTLGLNLIRSFFPRNLAIFLIRIAIYKLCGVCVDFGVDFAGSSKLFSKLADNPIFQDFFTTLLAVILNPSELNKPYIIYKPYIAFLFVFIGLHDMVLHGLPTIFTLNIIQNDFGWQEWLKVFVMICPITAFLYFKQLEKNPVKLTIALFLLYLILIILAYQGLLDMGTYGANHHLIKSVGWNAAITAAFVGFFFVFGAAENMCLLLKGLLQMLNF